MVRKKSGSIAVVQSMIVMLKEVKHLAKVSCKVPARDTSDATLCQDDNIAEEKCFLATFILLPQKTGIAC